MLGTVAQLHGHKTNHHTHPSSLILDRIIPSFYFLDLEWQTFQLLSFYSEDLMIYGTLTQNASEWTM